MISVRVKQRFHDKDDFSKVYEIGDVCKLNDKRAKDLAELGLVEMMAQKKQGNRKLEE